MTIYTRNGIPLGKFNGDMLILAYESRGLDIREVHEGTGIPLPTLKQLSNGIRQPELTELQALSEMLRYPKHFFYREEQRIRPGDMNTWICGRVDFILDDSDDDFDDDYEELPTQLPLF